MPHYKIALTDLDGVLRAKYLSADKVRGAQSDGFGFCNVIFGWDNQDRLYDGYAPDPTYADLRATLDPTTERRIPWENDRPFMLADFSGSDDPLAAACPRSLLKEVIAKAERMGFEARFGPEFEWFAYRETPTTLAEGGFRPRPVTPGMFGYSGLRTAQLAEFHAALLDHCAGFDVDLEGLHTETGPGALEAALVHQPALEAADRAVLFKQSVREISLQHGLLASFMAKPDAELPGCGGHLHQSLWQDGSNVFYDTDAADGMSDLMRHYLAGQLYWLPRLLPLYAPTVNSYKRYVPGSWAATRANWGVDNRTTALRVIPGGARGQRLETRVPGADANPYLSIAAALASGLYGIEHRLELTEPAVTGSAYATERGEPLARDLGAAAGAMREWLRAMDDGAGDEPAAPLPRPFLDHFLRTRLHEWDRFRQGVTDWERRRYLELA